MAKTQNKNSASVLAFDRRLSSSNALFYGTNWESQGNKQLRPLPVEEKSVRGVIDHRVKSATQTKVEAEIENANLQTVDYCSLAINEDTLVVKLNLQMAGNIEPCACNNPAVAVKINDMVGRFADSGGFFELCKRYVYNMANARFLWRNRLGAEKIIVKIDHDGKIAEFDALAIPAGEFDFTNPEVAGKIDDVAQKMSDVLAGNKSHANIQIEVKALKLDGLEVYPSQELITDSGKGKKSKYLFVAEAENGQAAALHPQKVTNAIHAIDNWHKDEKEPDKIISVNSFGAVTNQGKAFRKPGKNDFYTLFDRALENGIDSLEKEEQYYVMAMLVRGGVFGGKGD
jgi:CRISPR-associated protein Csy3